MLASCLFDATRDRLKQLHEIATCVEGDLTWPLWAPGRPLKPDGAPDALRAPHVGTSGSISKREC